MNVLHLVTNKVWGGGERYALDLAKTLAERGHTVKVFTRRKPAVIEPFQCENLHAGCMRFGGVWDVFTPIRLAKELNALEGDIVVHVHNFKDAYTAIAARRLYKGAGRVKIVCTRHLVKPAKTSKSHAHIVDSLDAVVFVSQLALDTYLSSKPAHRCDHLCVVHNSIIAPKAEKRNLAESGQIVKLIFAGRIAPEKGLHVLIKALEDIKELNWTLDVYGSGKGSDVMPIVRSSRASGIDSRIVWNGHVDNVVERMHAADICVVPSVVAESFGLSVLEAFSQGLAVVTTNNGAQREFVVDGQNGLLVAPDNPKALAEALAKIINDSELRQRLSDGGVETFNNTFDYNIFVDRIVEVYNK